MQSVPPEIRAEERGGMREDERGKRRDGKEEGKGDADMALGRGVREREFAFNKGI